MYTAYFIKGPLHGQILAMKQRVDPFYVPVFDGRPLWEAANDVDWDSPIEIGRKEYRLVSCLRNETELVYEYV